MWSKNADVYISKDGTKLSAAEPGSHSKDALPGSDTHNLAGLALCADTPRMHVVISPIEVAALELQRLGRRR